MRRRSVKMAKIYSTNFWKRKRLKPRSSLNKLKNLVLTRKNKKSLQSKTRLKLNLPKLNKNQRNLLKKSHNLKLLTSLSSKTKMETLLLLTRREMLKRNQLKLLLNQKISSHRKFRKMLML
jgi:hypothetical protein